MNDDDLDLDGEEASEPDSNAPDAARLQKENEKLRKENHSLRVRHRRSEMAQEYGADVMELVDDDLPLEKQKALAAKLDAKLHSDTPNPSDEAGTPEPPAEEAPAGLAAVAGSSATGAESARSEMTPKEILALGKQDQAAAMAQIKAQFRA